MSVQARRKLASQAASRLAAEYGCPGHDNKPDPLDELVFIVLSQMTTHHSFRRVYDRLKAECSTWDRLRRMTVGELRGLIAEAGLSGQKAPRLKGIAERLYEAYGQVTLAPLAALEDEEALRFLTSLPGVGTKTAKCVLMYSLGRSVLPVDTHVWRLGRRLGLVDPDLPYDAAQQPLEDAIPGPDRYDFHVNGVAHGRACCIARTPQCGQCCLIDLCPTAEVAG